ncbi:aminoglycoside 2'-N-acetyltransferase [Streptacidiphilus pinicola]|uniref:Aminoglycoside 2'-N-acetyltransferase n=1 Tax=Streptacidiphilus pinicola TaxID=2219663 RepID=A0A2X0IRT5_9ACTN|nr:GNAT family N-acetyltransferase [Streptacidiphilus pinicola]RAG85951.1 aminoglycoside 2'-N-acetyltransferase [Streptacidiphilus pinicola]
MSAHLPTLRVAHTADLEPDERTAARALLYRAFDDMTEDDWEHCLGGVHALLREPSGLVVAHAAVVQRRLLHLGRAWRVGYVEGVAVEASHRRRGYGGAVMAEVERIIDRAYEFGALGSSDEGLAFYAARGWRPWQGPTSALTPTAGVIRTPDEDGSVFVHAGTAALDPTAELTCDWRDGDVW